MGIESGMTIENFEIVLMAYWKMLTYFWPIAICAMAMFAVGRNSLTKETRND